MIRKSNECHAIEKVINKSLLNLSVESSHASHTIRDFRYPRLILELRVRASFCLPQQIFNFLSNL